MVPPYDQIGISQCSIAQIRNRSVDARLGTRRRILSGWPLPPAPGRSGPSTLDRMDSGLKREIEQKVYAGERLSYDDGVALYGSDDLAWLGGLAHHVRTQKNGDRVMFNVNRHLNMTNVCAASCKYCSFQRKPGEKDAYTMRIEEAVRLAKAMEPEGITELHIVNGLHPTLPWRYYPRSLRELKKVLPNVSLKAFTATEIHWFEKISGLPADEILDELIDAGLESLTGGGAEIFDWEIRQQIVDHATHWEDWSRIHRLAHSKGLKTPCTMLYGHIEEPRHRVDHVLRLRELQDETGGFQVFIPLRYQHDFVDSADGVIRNQIQARTTMATPAESLKTFAVSRLLFDNVPHVKCFWVMHGLSVGQLSLNFGVDDLDGSVVEYKITHDADSYGTPDKMTRDGLLDLIRDAGFTPVERNTRYEVVHEYDGPIPLAERRAEPQPMWS
jgi:aminodeoxyfutalosine synthase